MLTASHTLSARLEPSSAIFLFAAGKLPPTGKLLSSLWSESADEDGFLYITYSGETTFGG